MFRLRQIESTATGREIVRDRDIDKKQLTVGRAAENDIHLPDLAIDPQHATIATADGVRIDVKAVGTLGFTVDGSVTSDATINSRSGAEMRFGSYLITVSRDADDAILLLIKQAEDGGAKSRDLEEKQGFSLLGVMPGKRTVSWGLAVAILLVFLALPIGSYLTRGPKDTVIGDSTWSSGKLSLAHHGLEDRCEACHVKAFVAVRDETCMGCHKTIHDHAKPERLLAAQGGQPFGTQFLWSVAHAFGKPGPGACADCHREHEGATKMAAPLQQFCADCHADIKDKLGDTRLGDAGDFGKLHPEFTPAVVTNPFTHRLAAVSLDNAPRENSGLTFPHKLHLDKLGGVARMAGTLAGERGYGTNGLDCKDCHRSTEDGVRFKPIEMERDCEGCHSMAYDKVAGIYRQLKHGDVEQMIADLSAADVSKPIITNRARPGNYAAGGTYHFDFSDRAYNGILIRNALSRGGICGECHTPTFENGRPGVVPVTLVSRYMQHGWFDHKAHAQEKCASCHMADKSSSATDVMLPGIKSCRTCHLGENATEAKVPSGCAMCHSYHPPSFPPARDRLARN